MLGFVMLKSGCRYDRGIKKSAKVLLEKEKEYDFETLDANGQIDTVRYWNTDTFVVVKKYIPSPKSAMVIGSEEIFKILIKDSLPSNFQLTNSMSVHPAVMRIWEKAQELKQKKKYKKGKAKEKESQKEDVYMNSSKYSRAILFREWEKDSLEKDSL
jgi:hypothetical protein